MDKVIIANDNYLSKPDIFSLLRPLQTIELSDYNIAVLGPILFTLATLDPEVFVPGLAELFLFLEDNLLFDIIHTLKINGVYRLRYVKEVVDQLIPHIPPGEELFRRIQSKKIKTHEHLQCIVNKYTHPNRCVRDSWQRKVVLLYEQKNEDEIFQLPIKNKLLLDSLLMIIPKDDKLFKVLSGDIWRYEQIKNAVNTNILATDCIKGSWQREVFSILLGLPLNKIYDD